MTTSEFYYEQVFGYYPFDTDIPKNKTQKVLDYLQEAGATKEEIIQLIEETPRMSYLTPDMLPEWLWEGSLLEKGVFYYHKSFHIKPSAPVVNPLTGKIKKNEFYLEMKIKFSLDDLVRYFYKKAGHITELENYSRDKGAFSSLLLRYKKITFIEPVDFIMALIDQHACQSYNYNTEVFDITKNEGEVYKILQQRVQEAKLAGKDMIVWR